MINLKSLKMPKKKKILQVPQKSKLLTYFFGERGKKTFFYTQILRQENFGRHFLPVRGFHDQPGSVGI
jgi:hypothetical protein